MSDMKNLAAFWGGFLIGLSLGAGMALLLAPQSGQETRQQIKAQTEMQLHTLQEKGKETLDKSRHSAIDALHQSKERLMETLNQGQESLTHLLSYQLDDTPEFVGG